MGAEIDWPLKGQISLSSVFCDYRPFHYHSGLDLRTGGKVGLRVYAPADGHLYRTRTSFWGYGKALYLQLEDGRILVFGHLSRFSTQIEKRVFQQQVESRSYYTDSYYEPGEIPITRGQLLGYSGQTGAGGPHLHFEMRDQDNHPINPLKNGFEIEDQLPPRFLNLAVRDLSAQALGQDTGSYQIIPAYYDPDKGSYELAEVPAVSGRFGLEVNVVDRIYTERDYYGVYALEFLLDDSLLFRQRFDTISYETTRQQELCRDFGIRRVLSTPEEDYDYHTYYNLYDLVHEPLGGVLDTDVDEFLFPGRHQATVKAHDCSGNCAELHFELLVDRPAEVLSLDLAYRGGGVFCARAFVNPGDYAIWMVEFDIKRDLAWQPLGSLPGEGGSAVYRIDWVEESTDTLQIRVSALDIWETRSRYLTAVASAESLFAHTWLDTGSENIIKLSQDHQGGEEGLIGSSGGVYRSEDAMVSVRFEPGSLYFGIRPRYRIKELEPPCPGGVALSAGEFFPQTVPFIKKAKLSYDLTSHPGERSKLGIYELKRNGDFEFRGNELDERQGTISAEIDYFATFVLLQDTEPPRISRLYPGSGSSLTNRTPRIFAQLEDNLSGIVSEKQIEVTIDGVWVPAEYDYETKELYYRVARPLKPGKHTLVVSAADACGNKTVRSSVFTIAGSE